jgi:DNA-binding response OmpR family regulator
MNEKADTILLAGDNGDDLDKLALGLQAEKFKVLPVKNRDSVITLGRSELPSLILLDFQSCFDICRILKRNFLTEPIPIIALLFPAEEVDRVAALELGADDCLAKPINFRELTLRMRCSLNRARDKKGKAKYQQSQYYSALARPPSRSKADRDT